MSTGNGSLTLPSSREEAVLNPAKQVFEPQTRLQAHRSLAAPAGLGFFTSKHTLAHHKPETAAMCRFLVYRGSDDIILSKLILDPTHSILRQSFDSRLRLDTRRGQNNADGFGIGWYTEPKLGYEPCIFKSTTPAWNCSNLPRIASKTASRLVFAHVRATTEGSLSEDNCHPFCHGSLMWMHNGGIGAWKYVKRRLGEKLEDKWYLGVTGGTDSEWAFALFLDRLERMGVDPSSQPPAGFNPTLLRRAMLQTIETINELTSQIPERVRENEQLDTRSLLNFAVSDGHSIVCTRYVSSKTDEAASLFFSSGTQWGLKKTTSAGSDYQMDRQDKGADVVLVASEPLTFEREKWVNVPTNSILTVQGQTVMISPILDEYQQNDPHHKRSTTFADTKGLISTDKNASSGATLPDSSSSDLHNKLTSANIIPSHSSRSQTPDRSQQTMRTLPTAVQRMLAPGDLPIQGNIKRKRRSLGAGEWAHPAEYTDSQEQHGPDSPVLGPSRGSDLMTSEKAARVLGMAL